jgi:hypothetical protein
MARFTFPEWTRTFHKWVLLLALGAPVYIILLAIYGVSPEAIRIGYMPQQPVPYSHALHVGELGLDCRYCHNTVERAGWAAVPPAETCMNCHTAIRADSSKLLPIREAYADDKPVKWAKVHDLPDYVYFNHSAHVTRGIGCESCHGRIDLMEEVHQVAPLTMGWCLGCHREPEKNLRPLDQITTMGFSPPDPLLLGRQIKEEKDIHPPIHCSTCHR